MSLSLPLYRGADADKDARIGVKGNSISWRYLAWFIVYVSI